MTRALRRLQLANEAASIRTTVEALTTCQALCALLRRSGVSLLGLAAIRLARNPDRISPAGIGPGSGR